VAKKTENRAASGDGQPGIAVYYAQRTVVHGSKVIRAGELLWGLPRDAVEQLLAEGAIGKAPPPPKAA
jgi:hypothetical protein